MKQILLIMIGISVASQAGVARFTRDNTTQIVTDNITGLQWQDDVNITKNWTNAIGYCESLTLGGYTDWRLPNFNELYYIADRSTNNPAINSAFKNVVSVTYWSSSTVVGNANSAWAVDFYFGLGGWNRKSGSNYVRCVRARQ